MKFFVYNSVYYNRDLVASIFTVTNSGSSHDVRIWIDGREQTLANYTTLGAAQTELQRILDELL